MNKDFRGEIQEVASDSIKIMKDYINGRKAGSPLIDKAIRMIQFGVKIEHMNQLKDIGDKSIALRLIKWLPKDIDRDEYIRTTNPQIQNLKLLPKPKK